MKVDRNRGPMTYRLHVVGSGATEVVTHAAGLIVDRVMAGWRVTVGLPDTGADVRALRILGAEVVDLESVTAGAESDGDRCVLAIGTNLYARSELHWLLAHHVEVLVWGKPVEPSRAIRHRLSAGSRAFKAQALVAAGISAVPPEDEEFAVVTAAAVAPLRA